MSKIYSNKIQKVARSWLNTKFHYGGRIKINDQNNGGIDCIGLILKVGQEINSTYYGKNIITLDQTNYSKFSNSFEMKKFLDKYFIKTEEKNVKTGDITYINFSFFIFSTFFLRGSNLTNEKPLARLVDYVCVYYI